MARSLMDLKKRSNLTDLTEKLNKAMNVRTDSEDDKFWKPTRDKNGNGFAVIRFLPEPEGEDAPFIKMITHTFKGPGGWYWENNLSMLGKEDPVDEYNRKLWNSEIESNKKQASRQKRKNSFYCNIYVIKDSANPDNEGKVFLYSFGTKIMEKIKEAMNPTFEGEEKFDPFHLWEGADFKLKIRTVDDYPNYDLSEFSAPSVLGNFDDEKLMEIASQCHPLQPFVDPSNFKTYDQLKKRLAIVLGDEPASSSRDEFIREEPAADIDDELPDFGSSTESPKLSEDVDDDEDTLAFFKSLVD